MKPVPTFILAISFWSRFRGLLGTTQAWGNNGRILVIAPCKNVHTFGMNYPLDIAFVCKDGRVLRTCRDVPSGKLVTCRGAQIVLERPHISDAVWYSIGDKVPFELFNKHCKCGETK